ncbi:MAG: restriction endonuclease subunit S [Cyclobacteriaceae bacterium]|nr:restriction endonuclease subunit S [Cyclobacteriaceae bacterium]
MIPKLRFKDFKDQWTRKKIGDITTVSAGATPSTSRKEFWGGDIRWMNSGELNLKKVTEVENRITEAGLKNSSTKLIPVNSILIGLAGQGKTRGTAAMNLVELCTNQSIASIFPNKKEFISEYLYQNIDSRYEELRKLSKGDGGRGGLNLQIIKSFLVPIPSLPEQQKIASFLSAVDEKIQQLTRKKELLEQYKKGVMQQLFSGKLRFKDENGKAYPKWEEKPFGAICTFINGKAYKQEELLKQGKYRVLRVGNLFSNNEWYYSDLELEQDKYLEKGDLMYAWSASFGPRFWEDEKIIYHYHIWKVIPSAEVDKPYLFHSFMFDVERIKAVSQGGTMFHITKGNIETRKFKFPCKEEQQKIASFLTALDAKIESVAAQITHSQTFKKGLLQQMFV